MRSAVAQPSSAPSPSAGKNRSTATMLRQARIRRALRRRKSVPLPTAARTINQTFPFSLGVVRQPQPPLSLELPDAGAPALPAVPPPAATPPVPGLPPVPVPPVPPVPPPSLRQSGLQPSSAFKLPSSHSSTPVWTKPSPQLAAT